MVFVRELGHEGEYTIATHDGRACFSPSVSSRAASVERLNRDQREMLEEW